MEGAMCLPLFGPVGVPAPHCTAQRRTHAKAPLFPSKACVLHPTEIVAIVCCEHLHYEIGL